MKNLIAFLLVIIFMFFQIPLVVFADSYEISFEDFSCLVTEMIVKYNKAKESTVFQKNTDIENVIFENRLIVKTFTNMPLSNDCNAIEKIEGYDCLHILQYDSTEATQNAYTFFASQSNVDYVEFDYRYKIDSFWGLTDTLSTKEKSNKTWGSEKANVFSVVSSLKASKREFQEIVVAVIDSGIDFNHAIFSDRIVNSTHDYVENDSNPYDDNGHGTFVSGIIVNNTTPNVKIKPYKVADLTGYSDYFVTCDAIEDALNENVDLINISSSGPYDKDANKRFDEVLGKAQEKNTPVIVTAGNKNKDANNFCPARNNYAITVAATRINDSAWEKSNYGSCVDIAAPGSNIYSADRNNKKVFDSGTSAAAPFVSAATAVLKTVIPDITVQEIKNRFKSTAYVPPGWNTAYGAGIVDFKAMLADKMTSPPTVSVSGNSATITAEPGATVYYTTNMLNRPFIRGLFQGLR